MFVCLLVCLCVCLRPTDAHLRIGRVQRVAHGLESAAREHRRHEPLACRRTDQTAATDHSAQSRACVACVPCGFGQAETAPTRHPRPSAHCPRRPVPFHSTPFRSRLRAGCERVCVRARACAWGVVRLAGVGSVGSGEGRTADGARRDRQHREFGRPALARARADKPVSAAVCVCALSRPRLRMRVRATRAAWRSRRLPQSLAAAARGSGRRRFGCTASHLIASLCAKARTGHGATALAHPTSSGAEPRSSSAVRT